MDGGAWWAAVHGVVKSRTQLSDFTFTFHFPALEKEMATHSSVVAWRIPGTGEPSGLPSMGSHRVGHDWSDSSSSKTFTLILLLHFRKRFFNFQISFYWGCCCLVTKPCLTLCDLMDCSPPGSSVYGISQARILEWVAISFSRRSSWPRDRTHISCLAGCFFTTVPPGKTIFLRLTVVYNIISFMYTVLWK